MSSNGSHQINPFYIEPTQKRQWEGDYGVDDDDDDLEEEEGLLNDNFVDDVNDKTLRRRQRFLSYNQKTNATAITPIYERRIILGAVGFFLLIVLWMSSTSKKPTPGAGPHAFYHNNETTQVGDKFPDRVILLGERHSGLEFYLEHLASCFPQLTLEHELTRETMWFQDPPPQGDDTVLQKETILFILLVRDPYSWVESMRLHPQHMPSHQEATGNPLDWQDFVGKEWSPTSDEDSGTNDDDELFHSTESSNNDDELLGLFHNDDEATNNTENNNGNNRRLQEPSPQSGICQLGFKPGHVLPCNLPEGVSEDSLEAPVYELKPAKTEYQPFANILELRAAKLQHFLRQVPEWWKEYAMPSPPPKKATAETNVVVFHFEHTLWDSLNHLSKVTGWKKHDATCHNLTSKPLPLGQDLDPYLVTHLTEHINWQIEEQFGYHARNGDSEP